MGGCNIVEELDPDVIQGDSSKSANISIYL